jgi:hypothetical protein
MHSYIKILTKISENKEISRWTLIITLGGKQLIYFSTFICLMAAFKK